MRDVSAPPRCKGTIVIADDEEDTRELIREIVEGRGYQVATAANGLEALEVLVRAEVVCFLLLDLVMPRLDGFGVLDALAIDPRLAGIRVCISTSSPERSPPGLPCLPKPIDIERLFAIIEENCSAQDGCGASLARRRVAEHVPAHAARAHAAAATREVAATPPDVTWDVALPRKRTEKCASFRGGTVLALVRAMHRSFVVQAGTLSLFLAASGCGGGSDATPSEGGAGGSGVSGGSASGGSSGSGTSGKGGTSAKGGGSGASGSSGGSGASGKGGGGGSGASGSSGASGKGGSGGSGASGGSSSSGKGGNNNGGSSNGGSSNGGSSNGGSSNGGSSNGGSSSGGSANVVSAAMGTFVGINGFIDDPIDVLEVAGSVREYHDWVWCEGNGDASYPGYPKNQNSFSLWGGAWDFDAFYGKLAADGREVFPALQGGVPWIDGGAAPPVAKNADPTDPASYVAHADHLFQYAARYGKTAVDPSKLKLAPGQKVKSGLGVLHYYEDWNEQDANWVKPDKSAVFSPAEYAAMASADYDGHQGKLGATFGVKGADPDAKLVMGGLAGAGDPWGATVTGYLDGIRTWADAHRGGSFPADVLNVHHYCMGASPFGDPNPLPGVSPEACNLRAEMALVRAYRDQHLPGKELWLTEVGYDVDAHSRLRAPALGALSAAEVQGAWIVRSLLAVAAAGFDKAVLYISRDDSCTGAACSVQFATSGLTSKKGEWAKKPSFYFVNAFRARLAAMGFDGEVDSGNAGVKLYRFRDPVSGKRAIVAWSPTSAGTTVAGYSLALPGAQTAKLVKLTDGQLTGAESALALAGGAATLDVGEIPSIVLFD